MISLLPESTGLVNLSLRTPSLTRPFSLSYAYQRVETPEAAAKRRLRDKVFYKKRTKELECDPEATKQSWYTWWSKTRYSNDPAWRLTRQESQRTYNATLKHDEAYQMRQRIKHWLFAYDWVRKQLPWQSHRPIVYDTKTEHYCAGCKWTRPGGRRLYWQSIADTDSYLCSACYIPSENPDWDKILPKGYGDVRGMKALRARKQQLDASEAPPS
jgi:hypothetical protein